MIVFFDNIDSHHQVGGKAHSLSTLRKNNLPVPNGFVITADSFKNREKANLTEKSRLKISEALQKLSGKKSALFAVRSSAVDEDSLEHSFAGSFDSILNVSRETLFDAIEKVFESRSNKRVKSYSKDKGIIEEHCMAVIVQQMVDAQYAGVLFSADPVTGNYEHIIGNYIEGLGEDLVSGDKNPKIFTLERSRGSYNGPKEIKRSATRLWNYIHKIEKLFSLPMDIEWAVSKTKVYILQARPITSLSAVDPETGAQNDSLTGNMLWTNANVAEAVPDIMTPATWSLLKIFHSMGPIQFSKIIPTAANIAGRPYINVSFMISMYASFGKDYRKTGKGEFFGDIPENMDVPLIPMRKKDILPLIIRGKMTTIPQYIKAAEKIPNYINSNKKYLTDFLKKINSAASSSELSTLWIDSFKDYFEWSCRYLRIATIPLGDRVSNLRKKLMKHLRESKTNDILSNLSGESSSMVSLNLIRGMAGIRKGEISREEYIEESGMRGPHEFELSMPDMQEDPSLLNDFIDSMGNMDPENMLSEQKKKSKQSWNELSAKSNRTYNNLLKEFQEIAKLADQREKVRAEMIRVHRSMRHFYRKAGKLTKLGEDIFFLGIEELLEVLEGDTPNKVQIECRKKAHETYSKLPPYPALIKGKFNPVEWAKSPFRNNAVYDSLDKEGMLGSQNNMRSTDINGHGASSGIVRGKVRILSRPEDGRELLEGEILATVTTNIGWTPLFTKVAGIITDVGAPLSHAAIIARELGIPAVVGCGNACHVLKTGDEVELDGAKGTVIIINGHKNGK